MTYYGGLKVTGPVKGDLPSPTGVTGASNSGINAILARMQKQDKPAPAAQGPEPAKDAPKVGNCQGPLRVVVFVQDKFILGTTGMTDGVTVE
jgi:hypothetical protein